MTGTITSLRPGGFGFIASDAFGRPWALPFGAEAVIGGEFSRLRVGDVVRFDQVGQPGNLQRSHAVQVSRLLRTALPRGLDRGTRSD